MFVQIVVVLTRAKTAVFFLNEEEWGGLGGVQGTNLSTVEVFLEEVLGGLPFFRRSGVDFPDLGGEGVVKVDLVVIWSGWWDIISGFFGED